MESDVGYNPPAMAHSDGNGAPEVDDQMFGNWLTENIEPAARVQLISYYITVKYKTLSKQDLPGMLKRLSRNSDWW